MNLFSQRVRPIFHGQCYASTMQDLVGEKGYVNRCIFIREMNRNNCMHILIITCKSTIIFFIGLLYKPMKKISVVCS